MAHECPGRRATREEAGDCRRFKLAPWVALLATAFTSGAMAQEAEATGVAAGSAPSAAATTGGAPESPRAEAPKRAWIITPRVRVGETLTDNVELGVGKKQSDQVTELSPGITIDGQTARLKLHFDYGLSQFAHAQRSDRDRTVNSLNSFGTLEAVERWLFLDFSGTISQQSINAFQSQAPSGVNVNRNSTETSTFRMSPYIRGRLGGYVDYQVRYDRTTTHSQSNLAASIDNEIWSAQLSGDSGHSQLGWSLAASRQTPEYGNGLHFEDERLDGKLFWRLNNEWRLLGMAGRETNNYASPESDSKNTHGFGFDWNPSERTQLSATKERRFFGDGHRIAFNHRMAQSAWRYTDTRDVMVLPNQLGVASLGTLHDLVEQLFASEPDPARREFLVNLYIALAFPGVSPSAEVQAGFLNSMATIQRRQELSYIINGVRNTIIFSALRNEQQRVRNAVTVGFDGFNQARIIKQQGFNINWSHKLSAQSTLTAGASRVTSNGSGTDSDVHTVQKSLNVNFSTSLSAKSTATLGLRRNVFDGQTSSSSYSENVVTGILTARF